MRSLFFLTIIACATVYAFGNRCYSVHDCKKGECCTGGISEYVKGTCEALGQDGDRCDPNPHITGKYFLHCPCAEGLTCTHVNGNPNIISSKSPICKK